MPASTASPRLPTSSWASQSRSRHVQPHRNEGARQWQSKPTTGSSTSTRSLRGQRWRAKPSGTAMETHLMMAASVRRHTRMTPMCQSLQASLGCGNPLVVADLRPGEAVLDLGSGGGLDVLLSARRGPDRHRLRPRRKQRHAGTCSRQRRQGAHQQRSIPSGSHREHPAA